MRPNHNRKPNAEPAVAAQSCIAKLSFNNLKIKVKRNAGHIQDTAVAPSECLSAAAILYLSLKSDLLQSGFQRALISTASLKDALSKSYMTWNLAESLASKLAVQPFCWVFPKQILPLAINQQQ